MNDFRFDLEWIPVRSAAAVKYLFPDPISTFLRRQYGGPAVYRWTVSRDGQLAMVYYGEAENLARRIDGYRRGHAGQKTNARVKAFFLSLGSDFAIGIDYLKFEPFSINGTRIDESSLGKKDVRCFLENALIVSLPSQIQLLNKVSSLEAKTMERAKSAFSRLSEADRQAVLSELQRDRV